MTTRWWEIKITSVPELEDTIFWRLEQFGCKGTALLEEDGIWYVKGYVPAITTETLDLAALSLWIEQDYTIAGLQLPSVSWQLIDDEDWSSSWKQHWQPMEIGDRMVVYPAWIEPPTKCDRHIIRLDPGSAFGTGVHPTTQLCMESLEMRLEDTNKDLTLVDIGCGTGILAMTARLLGAKRVIATDIDPLAVRATEENTEFNHIDNIEVYQGSIDKVQEVADVKFDGITCNILAEIIKTMIPEMASIVKPNGWAILSGILISQSGEISQVLEDNGWLIAMVWKRDNWCCINARRQ